MRVLETLALHHDKWLRMAKDICSDPVLAEDIVGDMYIKLGEYQDKQLNDAYVYYSLKHIFIDYLREKEKHLKYATLVKHNNDIFEDLHTEPENKHMAVDLPDCLNWVEKQILILRQTKSGREIEKQYHINYQKVHRIEKKAKEKLIVWAKKYEVQEI